MLRDLRWLGDHPGEFIAISVEQIAFYKDVGTDRPELLQSLPFNPTDDLSERLRSFDLCPSSDASLALGYMNGKILITKVAADRTIRNLNNCLELAGEVRKPVTFLNFSPIVEVYLAACFEDVRSQDHTVCVYDVSNPKNHIFHISGNERVMDSTWFTNESSLLCLGCGHTMKFFDIRESTRPVFCVPVSSQVRSVSAGSAHSCIACIIDDCACIYDRRHLSSPLYRMPISYFKKNDTGVVKISWNPHSPTCLSCFRRNSKVVTELISPCKNIVEEYGTAEALDLPVKDTFNFVRGSFRGTRFSEDPDSTKPLYPYLELNHKFFGISKISAFSWHPEKRDRLLAMASEGGRGTFEIRLATINKFVTGDYSSQGYIAYASGNQLNIHNVVPTVENASVDISFVMKSRAVNNFGTPFGTTFEAYIRFCKNIIDNCPYSTSEMKWLWKWICYMISIVDWKPCVYRTLFPGVMDIMQHSLDLDKDELTTERIFVVDPFLGRIRLYKGKERDRVLRICGWPALGDIAQLDVFIDENIMERSTQSRAVAVALITANSARMKKALSTILEEARNLNDANLQEVETMHEALSHYRGVPEQWKSFSISLKRTIKDIYFNLIITFLDCRDNFSDLQCIIHQKDIPLEDRIAFAAIHFSDQYFMKSVKELMTESCLNRTLSGLLITGISYHKATHDLLSRYVDYTGDIQTATVLLAVGRCFVKNPSFSLTLSAEEIASADFEVLVIEDTEICVEMDDYMKRSCSIVYDYLDMLNTWRLWMQRARLDCLLGWKRDPTFLEFKFEQNTVQTEVCCQFCPQSIALEKSDITTSSASSTVLVSASRSSVPSTSSSNASTATAREISCPHCLKPLPKCILCHRHMGSYVQTECRKLGRLSSWFTWCQKCRHGGHMVHLWHWFNSHDECAASGCCCQCNIEDFGIFPMNADSTDQCLFCEDMY